MNPDINCWILEFIARQPISQFLLNKIITDTRIPILSNNPRLKKILLLRSIQDEIANGSASSEAILESLEAIEELDRSQQTQTSDSMILAYRAVAVDCTVKCLAGNGDEGLFFEAVKRIWRDRIGKLEFLTKSELVTDELRETKDEMEAALWDSNAYKRLLHGDLKNESLRLVKDYLKEALVKMGPSFLELIGGVEKEMKQKEKDSVEVCVQPDDQPNACGVADGHIRRDAEDLKNHVFDSRAEEPAGIMESERSQMNTPSSLNNRLPTPEVIKVKEALKSSSLDLRALVKDPLPNALHSSEALVTEMRTEAFSKETSVETVRAEGVNVPNPSIGEVVSQATGRILSPLPSVEVPNVWLNQTMKTNTGVPASNPQNMNSKPSLMDRNHTAQTFEWSDSIDGSPQETTNSVKRFQVDSPRRKFVSPLKIYKATKVAGRRQSRRWSVEEEDALREGVEKFGRGNWKLILNSKRDIFVDRTEVDLKDKWRNMTKW